MRWAVELKYEVLASEQAAAPFHAIAMCGILGLGGLGSSL